MSTQDHNPYYDSVRDKPDRSEFGSLRMSMQEKRPPPPSRAWLYGVIGFVVVLALAVFAKRFFA